MVNFENINEILIFDVYGEFSISEIQKIKKFIYDTLDNYSHCNKIILSFKNLEYIDSTGLGFIIETSKKYALNANNFIITDVDQDKFAVFKYTGIIQTGFVKFIETKEKAVEFLNDL